MRNWLQTLGRFIQILLTFRQILDYLPKISEKNVIFNPGYEYWIRKFASSRILGKYLLTSGRVILLRLQDISFEPDLEFWDSLILKTKEKWYFEGSVTICQRTRFHIAEEFQLSQHSCDELNSHKCEICYFSNVITLQFVMWIFSFLSVISWGVYWWAYRGRFEQDTVR
jgi:hypothetical protein